eukprot:676128-Prorocentrum_minimum.AAC.4
MGVVMRRYQLKGCIPKPYNSESKFFLTTRLTGATIRWARAHLLLIELPLHDAVAVASLLQALEGGDAGVALLGVPHSHGFVPTAAEVVAAVATSPARGPVEATSLHSSSRSRQ